MPTTIDLGPVVGPQGPEAPVSVADFTLYGSTSAAYAGGIHKVYKQGRVVTLMLEMHGTNWSHALGVLGKVPTGYEPATRAVGTIRAESSVNGSAMGAAYVNADGTVQTSFLFSGSGAVTSGTIGDAVLTVTYFTAA